MDVTDPLNKAHAAILRAIEGITDTEGYLGAVVKNWTLKDALAHICAREHLLGEILSMFIHMAEDKPFYDKYSKSNLEKFDNFEVEEYKHIIYQEIRMDYISTHDYVMGLVYNINKDSPESFKEKIHWRDSECSLQEYIQDTCDYKLELAEKITKFRQTHKHGGER